MYSLFLPLHCFDHSPAALERPADWRRRMACPVPAVRVPLTGLLRVRAMNLRRTPAAVHPERWSLV